MSRRLLRYPAPYAGSNGGGNIAQRVMFPIYATKDGSDNAASIQAQIDAMPDYVLPTLIITDDANGLGHTSVGQPLRFVTKKGLGGLGRHASGLRPVTNYYGGDIVLVGAKQDSLPHGAPLWPNTSFSWTFEPVALPAKSYFLNLGRYGVVPTNFNQFWYERKFRIRSNTGNIYCACAGAYRALGYTTAFSLSRSVTDGINAVIRIGGVTYNLTSTTSFVANDEVVAAVGYDGTTVYLFINGTIEDTVVTAGGTFSQNFWETWSEGPAIALDYPGQTIAIDSMHNDFGGARLGSVCRHTVNYVPSVNFWTQELNDLFVIIPTDTSEVDTDLIRFSLSSNGWGFVQVNSNSLNVGGTDGFQLEDIDILTSIFKQNTACRILGSLEANLERCYLEGNGLIIENNSYKSKSSNIIINSAGARIGMQVFGASGLAELTKIDVSNVDIGYAFSTGIDARQLLYSNTLYLGMLCAAASGTILGSGGTDEFSPNTQIYGLWVTAPEVQRSIEFINCDFETVAGLNTVALIGVGAGGLNAQVGPLDSRIKFTGTLRAAAPLSSGKLIEFQRPITTPVIELDITNPGNQPITGPNEYTRLSIPINRWRPQDISGGKTIAWYSGYSGSCEADLTQTTLSQFNGVVARCRDLVANLYAAEQATAANQPLFIPNVHNNRPAIRYDGVNDTLANITQKIIASTNPRTVIIVARRKDTLASPTPNDVLFRFGIQGTGSCFNCQLINAGGNYYIFGDGVAVDNASTKSLAYIGINPFCAIWRNTDGTDLSFRLNGENITLSGTTIGTQNSDDGFAIGAPNTNPFRGDIFEVIILDEAISDDECIIHEQRMIQLYGNTLTIQE